MSSRQAPRQGATPGRLEKIGSTLPGAAFHPAFWLAAFVAWLGIMWWLSSQPKPEHHTLPFRFVDKIFHFGWFFGGAGLLSAFLLRFRPASPPSPLRTTLAVALLAGIGALDEWHQSWVPGRSANDLGDMTADLLGAIAGVLVFRFLGRPMLSRPPDR